MYFQGYWDPLSPFYVDDIRYKGHHFKTSEHAYHYDKAVFHTNWKAATEIQDARTPAQAKAIGKSYFPSCSEKWVKIRFKVMEDIMWEKLQMCDEFKKRLINSGNKRLIHNMEGDVIWGFGHDGQGCDEMGKMLMRVKGRLQNLSNKTVDIPSAKRSYASVVNPTTKGDKTKQSPCLGSEAQPVEQRKGLEPTLLVIGNSNVRGLSAELNSKGATTTGYVFSGAPSAAISQNLKTCRAGSESVSHIFLHTADIDDRNFPQNAVASVMHTIDEALRVFNNHRLLINTLSEYVTNPQTKQIIHSINIAIEKKCRSTPELSLIDSKNLELKDNNIHFTATPVKIIAIKVLDSVHYINI